MLSNELFNSLKNYFSHFWQVLLEIIVYVVRGCLFKLRGLCFDMHD